MFTMDPTPCSRAAWAFALKLSFDSCLIYNRPYLPNLLSPKFIEYILGKGNSLPVYMESKELSLWRTVESQPARYIGSLWTRVKLSYREEWHVPVQAM